MRDDVEGSGSGQDPNRIAEALQFFGCLVLVCCSVGALVWLALASTWTFARMLSGMPFGY